MKKITTIIVLLTLTFISKSSKAQVEFMHSVGIATHLTVHDEFGQNFLALMYAPRLNVVQLSDESNISVGTRLGIGFNYSNLSPLLPMFEIPLIVDYNMNALSSKESYEESGFFIGGGFNYNSMTAMEFDQNTLESKKVAATTLGWTVNGGMTFNKDKKKFAVRAAYTSGITNSNRIISLGILYFPLF
jgi:hypothetical protein